jgi:pyroglutamyl-peptidase
MLKAIMQVNSLCVLVTGFGGFPGAAQNPTSALIRQLERHRPKLARQGIRLELRILPVLYDALPKVLHELHETIGPDIVLHFGLASRRKCLSLETRAKNRLSLLHPDAGGARAKQFQVVPRDPAFLQARFPVSMIKAQLNRAGLKTQSSIDAGDYICNQALYLSLKNSTPLVGFIHVPKLNRLNLKELERMALLTIGLSTKAMRFQRGFWLDSFG